MRAAHNRTGKNSRATCSSSGSFFLITPCSRSTSCMDPSACMLTWPSSENSGLEILCAASTASGLQPILAATIFAASLGWSFMKRAAEKMAFCTLRIWSAFFLMPSSDTYWIWLIRRGVEREVVALRLGGHHLQRHARLAEDENVGRAGGAEQDLPRDDGLHEVRTAAERDELGLQALYLKKALLLGHDERPRERVIA